MFYRLHHFALPLMLALSACTDDPNNSPETTVAPTVEESIAKAKAMTADTRTWLSSFANLEDPANATDINLETVQAAYEHDNILLSQLLVDVSATLSSSLPTLSFDSDAPQPIMIISCVLDDCRSGIVNATTSNNQGITLSINGILNDGSEIVLHYATNIPLDNINSGSFVTDTIEFTTSGSISLGNSSISLDNLIFSMNANSPIDVLRGEGKYNDFSGMHIDGKVSVQSSGIGFSGRVLYSIIPLLDHPFSLTKFSLSEITYSGEFFAAGHSFFAESSIKLNNASQFDSIGSMLGKRYIFQQSEGETFGAYQYAHTNFGITELESVAYRYPESDFIFITIPHQTCFSGYTTNNTFIEQCVDGDALSIQDQILPLFPENEFEQITYFYNGSNTEDPHGLGISAHHHILFGILSGPFESEDYFANLTITYSYEINLDNHPAATATFFGNRDSFRGGNIGLTLDYNNQSLTIKYIRENIETEGSGLIEITNQDHVKLLIQERADQRSGSVIVDGNLIGSIEETNEGLLVIRYNDGTFETLQ